MMIEHAVKLIAGFVPLSMMAGAAMAATVSESDFGGDYSGNWRDTTVITGSPSVITGDWSYQNDYDFLTLTGLKPGQQSISITFSVPDGVTPGYSFSAGGNVTTKTSAYQYGDWEGTWTGNVNIQYWDQSDDVISFDFEASDNGLLNIGLYGTYGALSYSIAGMTYNSTLIGPSAAAPVTSPVPLPAGAWMLMTGLGALVANRKLRGKKAA